MSLPIAFLGAVVWLGVTFAAAALGSGFMPDAWYRQLKKPRWDPPNKVFAPVWTVLYFLMATAAWLVWQQYGLLAALGPLSLFVLQLVLNAGWTWLFFGLHRLSAALAEIVVLWLVILSTLISFWQLNPIAGLLLVPYLSWVSFATFLTFTIWRMNSGALKNAH